MSFRDLVCWAMGNPSPSLFCPSDTLDKTYEIGDGDDVKADDRVVVNLYSNGNNLGANHLHMEVVGEMDCSEFVEGGEDWIPVRSNDPKRSRWKIACYHPDDVFVEPHKTTPGDVWQLCEEERFWDKTEVKRTGLSDQAWANGATPSDDQIKIWEENKKTKPKEVKITPTAADFRKFLSYPLDVKPQGNDLLLFSAFRTHWSDSFEDRVVEALPVAVDILRRCKEGTAPNDDPCDLIRENLRVFYDYTYPRYARYNTLHATSLILLGATMSEIRPFIIAPNGEIDHVVIGELGDVPDVTLEDVAPYLSHPSNPVFLAALKVYLQLGGNPDILRIWTPNNENIQHGEEYVRNKLIMFAHQYLPPDEAEDFISLFLDDPSPWVAQTAFDAFYKTEEM